MSAPGRLSYRRGGSIRPLSSVMIIPLCSAPVAVVNVGPKKTGGSINAIAGDHSSRLQSVEQKASLGMQEFWRRALPGCYSRGLGLFR
jgi:hypothetical protein